MGTYFNPDNSSFKQDIRSMIYVDKTGLLNEMNKVIGTPQKCIALSHARRFGKSQAAGMIDAYYSKGSDSKERFYRTYARFLHRETVFVPEHTDTEILQMCEQAARVQPELRRVGWDVAITLDGPLLIEGNSVAAVVEIDGAVYYKSKRYLRPGKNHKRSAEKHAL